MIVKIFASCSPDNIDNTDLTDKHHRADGWMADVHLADNVGI